MDVNYVEEGAEQLAATTAAAKPTPNNEQVQRKHQFLKSLIYSTAIAMAALLLCSIGLRGSV